MFPLLPLLAAVAVPGDSSVSLTVKDPVLVTSSADTTEGTIEGALGSVLVFEVQGPPTGPLFLGFSPKPPFGAGSVHGVPISIDPATAFFPVLGEPLSIKGSYEFEATVPTGLGPGTSFWCQAAMIDTGGSDLVLTNGVRIDLREPLPADLPLLPAGRHVGLRYETPPAAAAPAMDMAWQECVAKGVDSYELTLAWTEVELAPGVFSTAELTNKLSLATNAGLVPYLNLTTIDQTVLTLPADLLDPADPTRLKPGLKWDSALVVGRFQSVLDIVTPALVASGGFFLAVGDQVDLHLAGRPLEVGPFADFVGSAAKHVHATQPDLAIGVSLTFDAVLTGGQVLDELSASADNLAWAYYPLQPDHTVHPPSVVAADLDLMAKAVAPRPLVIQECGYPAGYLPVPGNGSSPTMQREFIEALFDALPSQPKLRFLGLVQLGDVDPLSAAVQATLAGQSGALYLEHLETLGLREHATGAAKPAYAQLLLELDELF